MFAGKWVGWLALVTALSVLGDARPLAGDDLLESDERFLIEARVDPSGPGLLAFFRSRSPNETDRRELVHLVGELGHESFHVRERASLALVGRGPAALPALQAARTDPDPEIARRARFCMDEIARGPGAPLTAAAVRVLRARQPAGAVDALLAFLPFNEDEGIEEEVLETLCALSFRGGRPDPALIQALGEPGSAKRWGAAYVLARSGDSGLRDMVRGLLHDPDAKTRLRTAQGLATARDPAVVPALIDLLIDAPVAMAWQAEDMLRRLAGSNAPMVSIADGGAKARRQAHEAWRVWGQSHAQEVDWAAARDSRRMLGLTVVAEMDRNRVWECGPDGRIRWTLDHLQEPMDAHVLPSGRVLVAEYLGERVTERDLGGNIVWQKQIDDHPIACQRLANGNTFIVSYQGLVEVTPDGREVFHYRPGPGFFILGAQRLRNGHIVCVSGHGFVSELDAAGKELRTFQVTQQGGWCGVEGLANGHYLVTVASRNLVLEMDRDGKIVWECTSVASPYSASRLSNGNTLVVSMTHQRLAEVDRTGKIVWEKPTEGRPFHAHRR